jgi:hypothetical protein
MAGVEKEETCSGGSGRFGWVSNAYKKLIWQHPTHSNLKSIKWKNGYREAYSF